MNEKKKKKEVIGGWMATAHFPALGHNTMCCIVIGMAWARMARHDTAGQARWGAQQALRHGVVGRYDTASRRCDTAQ